MDTLIAVGDVVNDAVKHSAESFRSYLLSVVPADRPLTRRAVRLRIVQAGQVALSGLMFRTKVPKWKGKRKAIQEPNSREIVVSAWSRVGDKIASRMLSEIVKGISAIKPPPITITSKG